MADGQWCHIEIPVEDMEAAKRFYGECFGWEFQSIEGMDYTLYSAGEGGIGGGLMKKIPEAPQQMVNYVYCDDLDAAAKRVEENGGTLVTERMEVPGTGWFRVCSDPDGNAFALWQSAGPAS